MGVPRWPWFAVLAAALIAVVPVSPAVVERWFSQGLYAWMQPIVSGWSNRVPFAVLDVMLAAGVLGLIVGVRAVVRARGRRLRTTATVGTRVIGLTAVAYLAFALLWGVNYRRVPMAARLEMAGHTGGAAALALGRTAVKQLNRLHQPAHLTGWTSDEWQQPSLRRAFAATQRLLSDAPLAEPGRLKATVLGPYFRWTGVDGMVNPFALEVLANPDLLPFERPFVAAHEWAHLAGYAVEAEASFVGWLTCIRADEPSQYSGWLFVFWQLRAELAARDRTVLDRLLEAGPRGDMAAVAARLTRGQIPPLRRASWAAYDQYLKANRVEEGVRSYGAVITLVLRAQFDDAWVPKRRALER